MNCRIYKHSSLTIFETQNGKALIYECKCQEVILRNFSDKVLARALELGFAPAVLISAKPSEMEVSNG